MSATVLNNGLPKYASLTGRDAATGVREYEAVYAVETDSPHDGPKTVKDAVGIPKYGDYWRTSTETDTEAYLFDKNAEADPENTQIWNVTCTYSTATDASAGQAGAGLVIPEQKEVDLAPELEWDFVERTVAAYYAYEAILYQGGKVIRVLDDTKRGHILPIVNSARDFFDPPLERDDARLVLRLSRAVGSYNPILALQYANVLNSDTYLGFPPKTILLKPIRAKAVFEKGLTYFRINTEMHFRLDLWYHDVWDAGMREFITNRDKESPKYKGRDAGYNHIRNKDKSLVSEPVMLDGKGHALVQPGQALDLKEETPFVWRFRTEKTKPFGPLNLI
jgi:hypothetical protein